MCVGASGPGPASPFPCRALLVFLWRTVMFLDQGLLQIGVFFLVGLEWSKTTMLHFAQSLKSPLPTLLYPSPPSSVKSIAESFTLKPQKTNSTPAAWERSLQRTGNSQNVVYEVHSQSGLIGVAVSLVSFPTYMWASDPFGDRGRKVVLESSVTHVRTHDNSWHWILTDILRKYMHMGVCWLPLNSLIVVCCCFFLFFF